MTNAQKVALRSAESSQKCFEESLRNLQEECRQGNCPINLDHSKKCPDSCELKQKLVVLDWMRGVSRGNKMEWDWILQYALNGRKLWLNRYQNLNFKVEP